MLHQLTTTQQNSGEFWCLIRTRKKPRIVMASGETLLAPSQPPPLNGSNGNRSWLGSLFGWLPSWKPTSETLLQEAEKTVLQELESEYKDCYVPIGPDTYIRTLILEPEHPPETGTEKFPLVMIHGFGAGILQFYKNLDHLHSDRRLFAIDLPGFARSSRMLFTPEAEAAEQEFVDAIEKWREAVGLEKFILLGHSLGAFLSCSYAMSYPSRVRHLIMDDPWGVAVRQNNPDSNRKVPIWVAVVASFLTKFNPFTPVRLAGPIGPHLVRHARPDLERKFGDSFLKYIYHCNAQNPTGENAFFYMQIPFGWARRPLLERVGTDLDSRIPITFIYGTRSWMDNKSGSIVKAQRQDSYVDIHFIHGAGHHVHAEQPEAFNSYVKKIFAVVETGQDLLEPTPSLNASL